MVDRDGGPAAPPTAAFSLWMKRAGIAWEGLRICHSTEGGAHVVATQTFEKGSVLATIPKASVLSALTASSASVCQRLAEEHDIQPDEVLNVAVAHERALGVASYWYAYFRTLPAWEPIPCTWTEGQLTQLLGGTGLEIEARTRRSSLLAEHRRIDHALASIGHDARSAHELALALAVRAAVGAREYLHAASLTSSRAFYVDEQHGEALVPFADLLNHKAALVPDDAELEDGGSESEDDASAADGGDEEAALRGLGLGAVRSCAS